MEKTGHQIIEEALAKAQKRNPNNSPFDIVYEDASIAYQMGLAAAYQHALEMIPNPEKKG